MSHIPSPIIRLALVVLVLGGLALSVQAQPSVDIAAPTWQVRSVDTPKWFEGMNPRGLSLDAAGRPHVAYGGDHLYYAWFDGTFWQYTLVDPAPGTGKFATIAFGPDGTPHFLYYDAVGRQVRYATRDGAGWRIEIVQPDVTLDAAPGLALDAAGAPHAAYRDAATGAVIYTWLNGSNRVRETIGQAAGGGVDLVLDGSDTPHIIYGTGALFHVYPGQSDWETQTVDATGVMTNRSLALDSGGAPLVAYTGTNAEGRAELRLARLTRTGWNVQVVDTVLPREVGFEPSLRLDKQDYAHISYRAYNGLKYARWTGSEWYRQVVDAVEGRDTSLALDASGTPHITYRRGLELVYVKRPGLNWSFRTLDTARTTGTHTALAVDASGNAHVSYRDTESGSLRYARQAGEAWTLQVVDATAGLPAHTSIALQEGQPAIAYYAYGDALTPGKLQYARWTGSQWEIGTIDADVGPLDTTGPKRPALRFDGNGSPHVAYYDGSDLSVKVATRTGGTWHAVTVAGPTQTGEDISLALAADAAARLAYYDAAADALLFVAGNGAGWDIIPVATGSFAGNHNALALDAGGKPHLCFSRDAEDSSELRYARQTATGWQAEVIMDDAAVATFCSLALDGGDVPHVAYYDAAANELKYAVRDGGWTVEEVDSYGDVGRYVALALAPGGAPRIAYADTTARDLKFAALAEAQPTPTATATATASLTRTASPTPTGTATATVSTTVTVTPTATVTATATTTATGTRASRAVYLPVVLR